MVAAGAVLQCVAAQIQLPSFSIAAARVAGVGLAPAARTASLSTRPLM